MTTIIFIISIGVFSFQSEWIKYQSEESEFSVLVPGKMNHTLKEIPTEVGTIIFNTFQCTPSKDDRNALYIVHHYDYPDSLITRDTTMLHNELLEATVEESITTLDGHLDYKISTRYDQHHGILYRIKYNDGKAVLKSKAFIIGDHIFVLQVYATIDNSINNLMDYFLESFQYTGQDK